VTSAPRKKRTLGRGMGDLLGSSLESLVQGNGETTSAQPDAAASATAVAPRREPRTAPSTARVFAVASGKGGTGKSLLAVNLAVALAEQLRVCLIDADLALANAHILLGLFPTHTTRHLLTGERTLDEILMMGPRGLLLLPGASGVPEMASLNDADLSRFMSGMAPLFSRCDAAVLDCPAGLTRQSLLMLHGADVIAVVTTEDLTAMTDAYALIKTILAHRPLSSIGIVVNEARSAEEGAETFRRVSHVVRKFLGRDIPFLGTIPMDKTLERSVAERIPVVLGHPSSPSARALDDLAGRLWALQGIEPCLGFPERVRRTISGARPRGGAARRNGDSLCAS